MCCLTSVSTLKQRVSISQRSAFVRKRCFMFIPVALFYKNNNTRYQFTRKNVKVEINVSSVN